MRDAQGQTYWQWCRALDFNAAGDAVWDDGINALRLASRQAALVPPATGAQALAAAAVAPVAVDDFGTFASVGADGSGEHVLAGGVTEPQVEIYRPPAGTTIVDLAPTQEGHLLIAETGPEGDRLVIHDRLNRFDDIPLAEPGFAPDRIAVGPERTFVLDRRARALRVLSGVPTDRRLLLGAPPPGTFRPDPPVADAPGLAQLADVDLTGLDPIIDAVALADGTLAVLTLAADGTNGVAVIAPTGLVSTARFEGVVGAYAVGLFGDMLAFLVPGHPFAVVSDLPHAGTRLAPLGLTVPLRNFAGGRFSKGPFGAPLGYPSADQPQRPIRRLAALSLPQYAAAAAAEVTSADAQEIGAVWHRLYVDADLPDGCGLTIRLEAGDDPAALATVPIADMHPHRFGATPGHEGPRGVWRDFDSELPFAPRAGGGTRAADRCGLFTAVAQKQSGTVRRIAGSRLRIVVEFHGSGRATPRLYALRIWGPRAAWRDRYLPRHMALEEGPLAAGADFLDRYLAIFEGLFTPLEDQVAGSWRLTHPATAPLPALDWLAGWIGVELDTALSESAKRRLLTRAVSLWRRRGTLGALKAMLDIVTDGAVARGEIVVLEHFHLRRTFSTILGADLSDSDNPLVPWAGDSGNSTLGPTFFLGAEDEKSFFALFAPDLITDPLTTKAERDAARAAVRALLDDYAHRVTVLVHGAMSRAHRGLVARVIEREVPAHVEATILNGPGSLIAALSALVAVETRPGPPPPRQATTLGEAQIGQVFLTDTPTLDPRLEGGA
ncbi:MAG: phage tail protein [Pseudomonadota bacterium]